jgi:hypothetical protein
MANLALERLWLLTQFKVKDLAAAKEGKDALSIYVCDSTTDLEERKAAIVDIEICEEPNSTQISQEEILGGLISGT